LAGDGLGAGGLALGGVALAGGGVVLVPGEAVGREGAATATLRRRFARAARSRRLSLREARSDRSCSVAREGSAGFAGDSTTGTPENGVLDADRSRSR
jgi:hypothetical protein